MPTTYPDLAYDPLTLVDAEAFDGETDAATGLSHIAVGSNASSETPLVLQRRRYERRLFELLRPQADLMVVAEKTAGEIGVWPGIYRLGGEDLSFDGATGLSVTESSVVYIDDEGEVQIVALATGWPEDATTYIPLAEVTVAAGVVTAIADRRNLVALAAPTAVEFPTVDLHGADQLAVSAGATAGSIDIEAGVYRLSGVDGSYAGATNQAVGSDGTFVVYLDSAGALQIVAQATGWPANRGAFIPLATVTRTGGAITSVVDQRHLLSMDAWDPRRRTVSVKTADYTVLAADTGKVFTTTGAAGTVVFTLPTTGHEGLTFAFVNNTTNTLRITPGGSDMILYSGSSDGKYLYSANRGQAITLVGLPSGDWAAVSETRAGAAWTVQA